MATLLTKPVLKAEQQASVVTNLRLYTIDRGAKEGATVTSYKLKSGDTIPVIAVGEEGRGRKLSFLPVTLTNSLTTWKEQDRVTIKFASLGKTLKGGWKLIEGESSTSSDEVILVMPTHIGFRGGNSHTGDRINSEVKEFLPFPGEILSEGEIAQGAAGYAGSGKQYICKMKIGQIFRTSYSGRLYGAAGSHYYKVEEDRILCATWEERVATDVF